MLFYGLKRKKFSKPKSLKWGKKKYSIEDKNHLLVLGWLGRRIGYAQNDQSQNAFCFQKSLFKNANRFFICFLQSLFKMPTCFLLPKIFLKIPTCLFAFKISLQMLIKFSFQRSLYKMLTCIFAFKNLSS